MKLRLPEDHLLSQLVEQAEDQIFDMTPKDIALLGWSLARIKIQWNTPIIRRL